MGNAGSLQCFPTIYTFGGGVELSAEDRYLTKFTFTERDESRFTDAGNHRGTNIKFIPHTCTLAVNDTENDLSLRIAVVKETPAGEDDIEVAWGTVPPLQLMETYKK